MLGFHWRSRTTAPAVHGSLDAPAPDRVTVSVSAALQTSLTAVPELLGDAYRVVVDTLDRASVGVIGAVGLPGVAFLRLRYPAVSLLIVDDHWAAEPSRAAGYLDAGADGYVAGISISEIAAHIRALSRRNRPPSPTGMSGWALPAGSLSGPGVTGA